MMDVFYEGCFKGWMSSPDSGVCVLSGVSHLTESGIRMVILHVRYSVIAPKGQR
jgi:hypothetical protein